MGKVCLVAPGWYFFPPFEPFLIRGNGIRIFRAVGDEALLLAGCSGLGGGFVADINRPSDLVCAVGQGAMGRHLGETERVAGRHFYGNAFQFLANFRREPKEACLRVVPTFVQGAAMEAGRDLQAAVVFGNRLQRHPDGGYVDLLGIAIVLRVLVPGGLGPDLVGEFGAGIEDAVDGDFGGGEEVLRQGQQCRMDENSNISRLTRSRRGLRM